MILQVIKLGKLILRLIQRTKKLSPLPAKLPINNRSVLCDPACGFPAIKITDSRINQEFNSVSPESILYTVLNCVDLDIDAPEHEGLLYRFEVAYANFIERNYKLMVIDTMGGFATDDVVLDICPTKWTLSQDEAYALMALVGVQAFIVRSPVAKETYTFLKKRLQFDLAYPKSSTAQHFAAILTSLEEKGNV